MAEVAVKKRWTRVAFGDVVRLSKERSRDPEADGFERYVGLDHLEPGDLKIRRWGNVADGTTFTTVFRPGQVLFGKRRAYQRKVAVADFSGVCSGDIYVFEPKHERLLPELLPFICQTDAFFEFAIGTSAGSLSPRTNWKSLATFELALPSLEEQHRIAELFWAAEHASQNMRECSDLLQEVRARFCLDVLHGNYKRANHLREVALGDFATVVMGQSPPGTSYNTVRIGTALLNGPTEFGERHPTPVQYTTEPTRVCEPGDILFCVRGSSTGRQNVADGIYGIGRGLAAIRANPGISVSSYLEIVVAALESVVMHEAKGAGSTFPNITSKRLKAQRLRVPTIDIQEALGRAYADIRATSAALIGRSKQAAEFRSAHFEHPTEGHW